jgi:hypothetical protein
MQGGLSIVESMIKIHYGKDAEQMLLEKQVLRLSVDTGM